MIIGDRESAKWNDKIEVKCELCGSERAIQFYHALRREEHPCRSCAAAENIKRTDPKVHTARLEAMAKGLRRKAEANPRHLKRSGDYTAVYAPDHPRIRARASRQKKPAPYILEHILVMEKELGSIIPEHQLVHHINNQPDDNRIENLYLCAGETNKESQQIHNRAHHSAGQLVMGLVDSGWIMFENGRYRLSERLLSFISKKENNATKD